MAEDEQQPQGETDRVPLDPALREQVRASSWRRRFEAEAERAEMMETAFAQGRAEIHALRQQVADRDTEIQALREQLEAHEPATVPAPPPGAESAAPPNGRARGRAELPAAPAT